jgi:uncharacterized protein YcbX
VSAPITVSSLFVYPVKAFRGIARESVTVGRFGFVDDREYQVVAVDRTLLTQRKLPRMALVQAVPIEGGLRLTAGSDDCIEVGRPAAADVEFTRSRGTGRAGDCGDAVAAWLERVLGQPCRLVAIAEGYTRPLLLDVGVADVEVSFADAAPVLLANTASLDDLVARATEPFPMERFRPNLVVTAPEPWIEDRWRRARVGDAWLHAMVPWPRCAVPQIDQQTAEHHKEPAKVLRKHRWCTDGSALGPLAPFVENEPLFGMGIVAEPVGATISVGDHVEVLEDAEPVLPPPMPRPRRPG